MNDVRIGFDDSPGIQFKKSVEGMGFGDSVTLVLQKGLEAFFDGLLRMESDKVGQLVFIQDALNQAEVVLS